MSVLIAGAAGGISYWLVQVLAGQQPVTRMLGNMFFNGSEAMGWTLHLFVSVAYAYLFMVLHNAIAKRDTESTLQTPLVSAAILALVLAIAATFLIAPGMPQFVLWNHVLFFFVVGFVAISLDRYGGNLGSPLTSSSKGGRYPF